MSTPTSTLKNSHLSEAKRAKNDEFYTQWADIEREMNAYLEFDADVFRDKVILLPCDDPEWSNFTKFFALHFVDFGLKKLISTSYAPDSNPAQINYQPTLFESESPAFDAVKTHHNGKKFILEPKDIDGDGVITLFKTNRLANATNLLVLAELDVVGNCHQLQRLMTTAVVDGGEPAGVPQSGVVPLIVRG